MFFILQKKYTTKEEKLSLYLVSRQLSREEDFFLFQIYMIVKYRVLASEVNETIC